MKLGWVLLVPWHVVIISTGVWGLPPSDVSDFSLDFGQEGTPPAALNASPTPAPSAQPPQTQPPTAQPPVAQPPQAQTPSGLANAAPLGIGAGPPVGNALPPPISPAGVANFTEGFGVVPPTAALPAEPNVPAPGPVAGPMAAHGNATPTGIIAGASLGGIVAVVAAYLAMWWWKKSRRAAGGHAAGDKGGDVPLASRRFDLEGGSDTGGFKGQDPDPPVLAPAKVANEDRQPSDTLQPYTPAETPLVGSAALPYIDEPPLSALPYVAPKEASTGEPVSWGSHRTSGERGFASGSASDRARLSGRGAVMSTAGSASSTVIDSLHDELQNAPPTSGGREPGLSKDRDTALTWNCKDSGANTEAVPLSFDSARPTQGFPPRLCATAGTGNPGPPDSESSIPNSWMRTNFSTPPISEVMAQCSTPRGVKKEQPDAYIVPGMPGCDTMLVESDVSGRISVRRGPSRSELAASAPADVPVISTGRWDAASSTGTDIDVAPMARASSTASSTLLPELPWSDWEIDPTDLHICSQPDGREWKLGAGGYGSVYKALLDGVQEVAVKVFHDVHTVVQEADILREVAILKGCRDRNIVQFYGACRDPASGRILLVTEYMEAGDLWHAIANFYSTGTLSWYRRGKRIALEIARGLHHLHFKRIVHFDLKSANVLLTRDGTAKISDVGFANILTKTHVSYEHGYTFAWAAPEVLMGTACTAKSDMYSFGVVMWELVTGEQPRRGQLREIMVPEECPAEVDALITRCMDSDAMTRPTAKEAVEILTSLQDIPSPPNAGYAGMSRRRSSSIR